MRRLAGLLATLLVVASQQYEGELCATVDNSFGECKRIDSCESARQDIQNGLKPGICSYDKNVPIVCCLDPSILSAPASPAPAPLWPSEGAATQRPTQRPPAAVAAAQRPSATSGGRPTQRPLVTSGGRPTQRPTQRPLVTQAPPVTSGGRPTQRPTQRPPVTQTPPVASGGAPTTPTARPQWWQIPTRKRTESPPVIDNLVTTPISGVEVDSNQLPSRLQATTETTTSTEESERIIFNNKR